MILIELGSSNNEAQRVCITLEALFCAFILGWD